MLYIERIKSAVSCHTDQDASHHILKQKHDLIRVALMVCFRGRLVVSSFDNKVDKLFCPVKNAFQITLRIII